MGGISPAPCSAPAARPRSQDPRLTGTFLGRSTAPGPWLHCLLRYLPANSIWSAAPGLAPGPPAFACAFCLYGALSCHKACVSKGRGLPAYSPRRGPKHLPDEEMNDQGPGNQPGPRPTLADQTPCLRASGPMGEPAQGDTGAPRCPPTPAAPISAGQAPQVLGGIEGNFTARMLGKGGFTHPLIGWEA